MIQVGGIHGVSLDGIKDRWNFGAYDCGYGKSRSTIMCIAVFSSPHDEVMTTLKRNIAEYRMVDCDSTIWRKFRGDLLSVLMACEAFACTHISNGSHLPV